MTGDGGIRLTRNFSAGAVALIAAWSSYSHMVHVALSCGERPEVAYALPFSVDGMLVVATVVMVDDKRRAHRVRPIARLAFTAGVLASIGANIAAAHPSIGARIVDAWPAVALLLVVEMLARPPVSAAAPVPPATAAGSQPPPEVAAQSPLDQLPAEAGPPEPGARSADRYRAAEVHRQIPVPDLTVPRQAEREKARSEAQGNAAADPPVDRAATSVAPWATMSLQPAAEVPPAAVVPPYPPAAGRRRPAATTRLLARQILDAEPGLSRTEVASRLGVSTRRLREVLASA